MHSVMSEIQ